MRKWLLKLLDGFFTSMFRTLFFLLISGGISYSLGWNPIDAMKAEGDIFIAALFGAILGGFLAGRD